MIKHYTLLVIQNAEFIVCKPKISYVALPEKLNNLPKSIKSRMSHDDLAKN